MAFVAFLLGALTALAGAIGVVAPRAVAAMFHGPFGLAAAAALRIVLGAALVIAAPQSRAPAGFRVLGVLAFTTGCLMPLLGVARFDALLDWWAALDPAITRAWSACAVAIGLLISYGIVPRDAR
jgi:hypothetical protein